MLPQPVGLTYNHIMVSEFSLASLVYFLVVLGLVSRGRGGRGVGKLHYYSTTGHCNSIFTLASLFSYLP